MVLFAIASFVREEMELMGVHYVAKDHLIGIKFPLFLMAITTFFIGGMVLFIFRLHIPVRIAFLGNGNITKEYE